MAPSAGPANARRARLARSVTAMGLPNVVAGMKSSTGFGLPSRGRDAVGQSVRWRAALLSARRRARSRGASARVSGRFRPIHRSGWSRRGPVRRRSGQAADAPGPADHAAWLGIQARAVREHGIQPGDVAALLAAPPKWLVAERQHRQAQIEREARSASSAGPGQTNYAAANTYFDALSEHRRAVDLSATAVTSPGGGMTDSDDAGRRLRRVTRLRPTARADIRLDGLVRGVGRAFVPHLLGAIDVAVIEDATTRRADGDRRGIGDVCPGPAVDRLGDGALGHVCIR